MTAAKTKRAAPRDVNPLADMAEDIPFQQSQPPLSGAQWPVSPYGVDTQTENEMADEEALAAVLASFGDDGPAGKITIRRLNEKTRVWEWLDNLSIAEFRSLGEVEYIGKRWGGGKYECRIYDANTKLVKRPTITIAASVQPEAEKSAGGNDLARVLETMQAGFSQMVQVLQQRPANDNDAEEKFLRKLEIYKSILGGNEKPRDTFSDFGKLKDMAEFLRELQPREGDPGMMDTLMKFAEKFQGPITRVLENATAAPQGAQPGVPNSPTLHLGAPPAQPNAPPAQPSAPQNPPENMQMFQETMIKYYLRELLDFAQRGIPMEQVAASVIDKVPPAMLDEWIEKPQELLAKLGAFDPRVNENRAWFESLIRAIIDELDADTGPEAEGLGREGGEDGEGGDGTSAL